MLEFQCLLLDHLHEGDTFSVYMEHQDMFYPLTRNK